MTDDCLTANMERAINIVDGFFNALLNNQFLFESRVTDWLCERKEEAASLFSMSQTARIGFGVECGYDEGLRKVSKGLTMEILNNTLDFFEPFSSLGQS